MLRTMPQRNNPIWPGAINHKGRRTVEKERTRELILATARSLFHELGYEGVNMRRLAAAMGRSTGAVFGHYRTKDEVWTAATGSPPPDYALSEQIALLQGARPDAGWMICGRPDGEFEAHIFCPDGSRREARAGSAREAIVLLRRRLANEAGEASAAGGTDRAGVGKSPTPT
jgi:AcrR family transcriptional regulator